MPLIVKKPGPSKPRVNPNVSIAPPRYEGVKVDSKLLPRGGLLANMAGSQWIAHSYYSQYLQDDSVCTPYSDTIPPPDQQYFCIKNLELKVTEDLSAEYNNGPGEFKVSGTAHLFPGLIPNYGDVFIVDIGDSRAGLMMVTNTSPMTYFQATVYQIQYGLIGYMDAALEADLAAKTQKTSYYVRDLYTSGQDPLLIDTDFNDYTEMDRFLRILPHEYHRMFYNRNFSTYLVPSQLNNRLIYDPFITSFFKRMVDSVQHPWISEVTLLNCDNGNSRIVTTLLDAALEGDETIIDRCDAEFAITSAKSFSTQALFASVRYSGVHGVVFPIPRTTDWNSRWHTPTTMQPIRRPGINQELNRKITMSEALGSNDLSGFGIPVREHIQWVSDSEPNKPYIFSRAFYENTDEQSAIELFYRQAVRGEFTWNKAILKMCEDRKLWTDTTQYYYIPIMLFLLRAAIGNIRS